MNIWTILMILAIIIFVIVPGFKPRFMPVKKLLIMPVVFMYLFYDSASSNFPLNLKSYAIIALGILLGIAIGVSTRIGVKVTANRGQHTIGLPGSYMGLVVFLVIFAVHFAIGYLQATQPKFFASVSNPELGMLFLLAMVSSMTVGTSACLYYKYRQTSQAV